MHIAVYKIRSLCNNCSTDLYVWYDPTTEIMNQLIKLQWLLANTITCGIYQSKIALWTIPDYLWNKHCQNSKNNPFCVAMIHFEEDDVRVRLLDSMGDTRY